MTPPSEELQARIRKSVEKRVGKLFAPPKEDEAVTLFDGKPLTHKEVLAAERPQSKCNWCGRPCVWGTWEKSGKHMLGELAEDGKLVLTDTRLWVHYVESRHKDEPRYIPHWQNCPEADAHRGVE